MYIAFSEDFNLPVKDIFPYFHSPSGWGALYGIAAPVRALKDGWHAVPLKKFPFPLVARNLECVEGRHVRWVFDGFWRGVGEARFYSQDSTTRVEGFEYITAHGLWLLASIFERRFMEKEFARIWELGWERLRKHESQPAG